jgi:hypothetical protein
MDGVAALEMPDKMMPASAVKNAILLFIRKSPSVHSDL